MQRFNAEASKKTLIHTWYVYPIVVAFVTLLWIWAFYAFHQPSTHQILTVFVSAEVNNPNFNKEILKHYEREDLREVNIYNSVSNSQGFYAKMNLYIQKGDILILSEQLVNEFSGNLNIPFVEFTEEIKTKYCNGDYQYYEENDKAYGIKLKSKGEACWLDSYVKFEDTNYYLLLTQSSKNLGAIYDEKNEHYDNAFTSIKYFMGEQ